MKNSPTHTRAPDRQADAPSGSLSRAISFLRSIGIPCEERAGTRGFLTGVRVRCGGLVYDPACPVSNVLHEAGHIATVPLAWRHLLNDDVSVAHRVMFKDIARMNLPDPDAPLMRAALQCSDPEATAWAWAAGKHLGIPDDEIILDSEYGHDGAGIRLALALRGYPGINGLAHAGFCSVRAGAGPLPVFPALAHWTQPAQVPDECLIVLRDGAEEVQEVDPPRELVCA